MDLEQKAIERIRLASDQSHLYVSIPAERIRMYF